MNRILSVFLIVWLAGSIGCATKNYVKNQTTPLVNKVNELDDLTAQNTKEIKEVDARSQAGIQQAQTEANAADQKAVSAGQQATQAQTQADTAARKVDTLQTTVANLDNYHVVNEAAVQFGVNRSNLTKNAKETLDQLAGNAPNVKGYIFVIEGHTDSTGSAAHNNTLSDRRADAVVRHLVANNNIPAFRVYVVGLGEKAPVGSNKTSAGRSKNRRAEVKLMSNSVENATTAAVNQ
jgi:outer membrane protein OmpA-like peptidoglycan-associated protein